MQRARSPDAIGVNADVLAAQFVRRGRYLHADVRIFRERNGRPDRFVDRVVAHHGGADGHVIENELDCGMFLLDGAMAKRGVFDRRAYIGRASLMGDWPVAPILRIPTKSDIKHEQRIGHREMSYVTKILRPDEHLLAVGRLHWIIYKDAALALLLCFFSLHLSRTYQYTNETLASLMTIVCVVLLLASAVLARR
jgi:hypothetical protein